MAVRRLLKQETVLTIIMITVTTILIIGATVAWFLGNKPVTIKNYFQQAGGIDGIEVKMAVVPEDAETDGESGSGDSGESGIQDPNLEKVGDITYYTMNAINANNKEIDIDLAKLTNIEEGKLGPGSYGTIKFKISTTSKAEMKYIIRITPNIQIIDELADRNTNNMIGKDELLDLVQNHIKFYAVKDVEQENPNNVYQQVIPYYHESEALEIESSGLTGTVSANSDATVQHVTIYWYWPYEYTDIPGYGIDNYSSTIYHPWNSENGVTTYEGRYSSGDYSSIESRIEAYDWDDTKIGNYVTSLTFHFEVSAYQ